MNPLISIIVPVYNAESTLKRCVDSIVHQKFTDWELLLVDDGSRDNSGTICDEYIIRKSKFPQNPKRSVRFSGKRTKRSVQKRKARNTQKAETKVL